MMMMTDILLDLTVNPQHDELTPSHTLFEEKNTRLEMSQHKHSLSTDTQTKQKDSSMINSDKAIIAFKLIYRLASITNNGHWTRHDLQRIADQN